MPTGLGLGGFMALCKTSPTTAQGSIAAATTRRGKLRRARAKAKGSRVRGASKAAARGIGGAGATLDCTPGAAASAARKSLWKGGGPTSNASLLTRPPQQGSTNQKVNAGSTGELGCSTTGALAAGLSPGKKHRGGKRRPSRHRLRRRSLEGRGLPQSPCPSSPGPRPFPWTAAPARGRRT